ncbi:acetate--CoA ligase family protein [Spiribacter insolitus]|uniref:Acetate--CoA ligase family protein n=1 Tax=Spiribacter insolitus TaxID=3122417 RepID=A0ABV3T3K9_9GAMM
MARQKTLSNRVLRDAGLPVARQRVVQDPAQACAAAKALGFPVVIKPMDQDGGRGVVADLRDEEELKAAFPVAAAHGDAVLIEPHCPGRDYRLVVFNGELFWALERVPGGVTGDGVQTVRQLVDALNAEPTRRPVRGAPLYPLTWDKTAQELLARQGLDGNAIPDHGAFVQLRRTASVTAGGTPVAVPVEAVHPDNRDLAVGAARALNLDLAGVDVLTDDIETSWRVDGGLICEVNAQPSLGATTGPHLYTEILDGLIEGNGRIPIHVLVGPSAHSPVPEICLQALRADGLAVGLASSAGAWVGGHQRSIDGCGSAIASRAVLCDPEAEALLVVLQDDHFLSNGLPFDRCDSVIICGVNIEPSAGRAGNDVSVILRELLSHLLPACTGTVHTLADSGVAPQDVPRLLGSIGRHA